MRTSPFEGTSSDVLVSLYRSAIRFSHIGATLSASEAAEAETAPGSQGGAGVPPDLFVTMVLGSVGVDELARRHPDFRPGKQRQLLRTLFPRLEADVVS